MKRFRIGLSILDISIWRRRRGPRRGEHASIRRTSLLSRSRMNVQPPPAVCPVPPVDCSPACRRHGCEGVGIGPGLPKLSRSGSPPCRPMSRAQAIPQPHERPATAGRSPLCRQRIAQRVAGHDREGDGIPEVSRSWMAARPPRCTEARVRCRPAARHHRRWPAVHGDRAPW
jgi:hypothetical protein